MTGALFVLRLALREGRAARRQIGLYAGAISLGVAALVAIGSFRADVTEAIHAESRSLMGADVELRSTSEFSGGARGLLDSLRQDGVPVSRVTSFTSMALATATGKTRLVDVRAVEGDFPYYGRIETAPANRWSRLRDGHHALVDPALLVYLGAEVGDTLRLGDAAFVVDAELRRIPGEIGIQTAIGPRVYIAADYVEETNLLQFGSRARYHALLKLPGAAAATEFVATHRPMLDRERVRAATAASREEDFRAWFAAFTRFLALLGLTALLLGGIATGSAVHVFVRRKLDTVAVLRCLGGTQRTVFAAYLLQAALMGLVGAMVGVVLGLVVQRSLPSLLADFLPLAVHPSIRVGPVAAGLGIGLWVALAFGLLPLLTVRNIAPLRALRRSVEEPARRWDLARVAAYAAVLGTILVLSVTQAPLPAVGLAFALGITLTTAVLWATARALVAATRKLFPANAPYVVRQGIANLFRPHNQTVSVVLTVGFGVFLLGTLHVVQRNLLDQFAFETSGSRPNLVVFDIQPDQVDDVRARLAAAGAGETAAVPIVPARIAAIGGVSIDELLTDTSSLRRSRWALRREYRNTYRDTLVASERLIQGSWWTGARPDTLPARISVEEDLADELHVRLGDRLTWDFQGVTVETVIASVRQVDWARFETNFFVVFEPDVLESAPQTLVTLAHIDDARRRAEVQRDLVLQHSNLSLLDISVVQEVLERLLGSVALAIRIMAAFSIACGAVVVVGAAATSRFQRLRESVLLRTLGARTSQVVRVLAVEYAVLGSLASVLGVVLAALAGWVLVKFFFELRFTLPSIPLLALALGTTVVTTAIGIFASWDLVRRSPLAVLRDLAD